MNPSGNANRGALLLGVRVRSVKFTLAIWILLALTVTWSLFEWRATHKFIGGGSLIAITVATYALYPRIRFFERGVQIPATPDRKMLYLPWEQVARYSWDGNTLILTGTNSVLGGGPAESGTAKIPLGQRAAVEQVLSAKVRIS